MAENRSIAEVLGQKYKGLEWSFNGDASTEEEFKNALTIHKANGVEEPTWAKVQEHLVTMQAEYDAKQYQRDRKPEYGSWEEQLDMMYHGTWEAHVQAVRDKHPK